MQPKPPLPRGVAHRWLAMPVLTTVERETSPMPPDSGIPVFDSDLGVICVTDGAGGWTVLTGATLTSAAINAAMGFTVPDPADLATAAQGAKADTALQPAGLAAAVTAFLDGLPTTDPADGTYFLDSGVVTKGTGP